MFYEAVPSEIRTIQRGGRTGRKREGRVVVLVVKGTRDEAYLWAEKRKEHIMKETMREFKPEDQTPEKYDPNDATSTNES